jgi:dTDP-L-rhamnose 4-epimerase
VALRLSNTYGPRQALSNPYTGVLANFAARLLDGRPPLVYEDGRQLRDFVSVHDVARAFRSALEAPDLDGAVLNIGSGRGRSVIEVARAIAHVLHVDLLPEVTHRYRVGDIRHCTADLGRAEQMLGYRPAVTLEDGIAELGRWLAGRAAEGGSDRMNADLEQRRSVL